MKFNKLVPNIFYQDIRKALTLFVDCLEFVVTHDEIKSHRPFCVIEKDGLRINLFEDAKLAGEHHPELRLVTEDIESVYDEIKARHSELLHPNLPKITLRPWGAREFAIMDEQLGIIFQQWPARPTQP